MPFFSPSHNWRGARVGWLSDFAAWLASLLTNLWDSFVTLINTVMDWVVSLIQPALDWIGQAISQLGVAISNALTALGQWFLDSANAFMTFIQNVYISIQDFIGASLQAMFDWADATWIALIDWIFDDITQFVDWLHSALIASFGAMLNLVEHLALNLFALVSTALVALVGTLDLPASLQASSLQSLLGAAGPIVGFIAVNLKLPECLAVLGVGLGFRILRKLLTFGRW